MIFEPLPAEAFLLWNFLVANYEYAGKEGKIM